MNRSTIILRLAASLVFTVGLAACTQPATTSAVDSADEFFATSAQQSFDPPLMDARIPIDYPGLHNVVTYAPGKYSGSAPEGEDGFVTLQAMGIRTILSVDGAQPDVDAADAHGLRYVHLPIGYNGMDEQRTLEIARAIRDLPGPVYVHCHHGKHRSAGALGAAVVTLGLSTPQHATERMKVSGTAGNYTGLFQCVAMATVASVAELNAADNTFPKCWRTTGLVNTMVKADEVFELLKLIEQAEWSAPADHPDLVPVAEAGRLADLFRNLLDDERVKAHPMEMQRWMLQASRACEQLEDGLSQGAIDARELSAQFKAITQSCTDCHRKYRD